MPYRQAGESSRRTPMAAHDPEIRHLAAQLGGAARVVGLDQAARAEMNKVARDRLAEIYLERAREEVGDEADPATIQQLADDLRRVDLRRAALRSAQVRRERAAADRAAREAAELDQLEAAELDQLLAAESP